MLEVSIARGTPIVVAVVLLVYVAQALLAAWLADRKGHSFLLGFLTAALLPVIGLLAVMLAPARTERVS